MSEISLEEKVKESWLGTRIIDGEEIKEESDMVTSTYNHTKKEIVDKKKDYPHSPPYSKMGNGVTAWHGITSMNLLEVFDSLNARERKALIILNNALNKNTVAGEVGISFTGKEATNQRNDFGKGVRTLIKKDLVRRTRTAHYIINPLLIIQNDTTLHNELWDTAGKLNTKKVLK